jgi:hypothetical protein
VEECPFQIEYPDQKVYGRKDDLIGRMAWKHDLFVAPVEKNDP